MSQEPIPEIHPGAVLLMLGEMRGDLKYLVNSRKETVERLEELEDKHGARITRLENFKTKIGVLTTALGILVPTAVAAVAHKIGLL